MTWRKLERMDPPPANLVEISKALDEPLDELWSNDRFEIWVRYHEPEEGRRGAMHLSIKRFDRAPIRDWRHLQAIKNEIAGPEREALEIYPAESRLVDTSNQFHLWVLPEGMPFPIGYGERLVGTQDEMEALTKARGVEMDMSKARQRDWEDGISTGPDYEPDLFVG